jgi:molybdopterin converting factor small subunit
LKILLYGRLAEAIGSEVELDTAPGCSIGQIRDRLAATYPAAAGALNRSRAFIANALVADGHVVDGREAVEFMPPVSGG